MKANTKQATTERLNTLCEKRNALLLALEQSQTVAEDFRATAHELAETIAQIATYKTLLKLSDGAKDITTSGAEQCEKMLLAFPHDLRVYHNGDYTAIYSDAMDLFSVAYLELWQYFSALVPLALTDTVYTRVLKNGTEKDYTLFQVACKSIREYIHSWSGKDDFKRLHYCIGFTDDGKQVTTSTRPQDDLQGITDNDRARLFSKYGLTAQQQDIIALVINGESAESIARLLGIPLRTVQDNIKKAKARFITASAYAELCTARNAEKVAKAKAEKHADNGLYLRIYEKAQERTAQALTAWRSAFHKHK